MHDRLHLAARALRDRLTLRGTGRRRRLRLRGCALLTLLLTPALSPAQETVAPAEPGSPPAIIAVPGQRLYLVEYIVFNNLGPIPAGSEIWHRAPRIEFDPDRFSAPPETEFPVSRPIVPTAETSAPETAAAEPVTVDPIQFTQLDHLAPHLSKLHADTRYEVLTYGAWVQPLFDKRDAIPVPVMRGPEPERTSFAVYPPIEPPLSGTLRIFETRLLFVDVDVTNEFPDEFSGYASSTRQDRPPGKYWIREKRRVKLNELHYFDHPFFGLLVRVSRYEPELAAPPEG